MASTGEKRQQIAHASYLRNKAKRGRITPDQEQWLSQYEATKKRRGRPKKSPPSPIVKRSPRPSAPAPRPAAHEPPVSHTGHGESAPKDFVNPDKNTELLDSGPTPQTGAPTEPEGGVVIDLSSRRPVDAQGAEIPVPVAQCADPDCVHCKGGTKAKICAVSGEKYYARPTELASRAYASMLFALIDTGFRVRTGETVAPASKQEKTDMANACREVVWRRFGMISTVQDIVMLGAAIGEYTGARVIEVQHKRQERDHERRHLRPIVGGATRRDAESRDGDPAGERTPPGA